MGEYFTLCAREHQLRCLIDTLITAREKITGRDLRRNVLVVNAIMLELHAVSTRLYHICIEDISMWSAETI